MYVLPQWIPAITILSIGVFILSGCSDPGYKFKASFFVKYDGIKKEVIPDTVELQYTKKDAQKETPTLEWEEDGFLAKIDLLSNSPLPNVDSNMPIELFVGKHGYLKEERFPLTIDMFKTGNPDRTRLELHFDKPALFVVINPSKRLKFASLLDNLNWALFRDNFAKFVSQIQGQKGIRDKWGPFVLYSIVEDQNLKELSNNFSQSIEWNNERLNKITEEIIAEGEPIMPEIVLKKLGEKIDRYSYSNNKYRGMIIYVLGGERLPPTAEEVLKVGKFLKEAGLLGVIVQFAPTNTKTKDYSKQCSDCQNLKFFEMDIDSELARKSFYLAFQEVIQTTENLIEGIKK